MQDEHDLGSPISLRVLCLDCSHLYEKPEGGGSLIDNPGCPLCGYLGWAETAITKFEYFCRPFTPLGRT